VRCDGDEELPVAHLDPALVRADPKPFLGYSDNTNLLNWWWTHGVAGFYGGSTQVQLGPGPAVDEVHARSLRAALLTGERLDLTDPGCPGAPARTGTVPRRGPTTATASRPSLGPGPALRGR